MENNINNDYGVSQDQTQATYTGVIVKAIIGFTIASAIAFPRLYSSSFFGEAFMSGGGFSAFFGAIIFMILAGIIWFALLKMLKTDHGPVLNTIIFAATSAFAGLFFANSLIVTVSWTTTYSNISDPQIVIDAIKIASIATFAAVIGGILMLPRISMTGKTAKIMQNIAKIALAMILGSTIIFIIGMFFALFGMYGILDIYGNMLYGSSSFSILFSLLFVFIAEAMFIGMLGLVKHQVENGAKKHEEYFLAIILVNAIIRLFVEIFRLVLKILARSRD